MTAIEREPVAQAINYIISALNIIAGMATDPSKFDEVAAEEAALWTIKNHAEWLLSYIDIKQKEEMVITPVVRRGMN